MKLITTRCILCGEDEFSKYKIIRNSTSLNIDKWTVVSCNRCGLRYTNPRLSIDDITKLYQSEYNTKHYGNKVQNLIMAIKKIKISFTRRVDEDLGNSILDSGCGDGHFLISYKSRGYDVCGLDLDERLAENLKSNHGINVFTGELSSISKISKKFNHITMYHFLEHSYNPGKDLDAAYSLLDNYGKLYIEVPNSNSIEMRLSIFKDCSALWSLPFHTYHFTEGTLRTLLKKHGFKVTKIRYPYFLPYAFSGALLRRICYRIPGLLEPFLLILLFPFSFGLTFISSRFKKSPVIYLEAVKELDGI